MVRLPGLNPLLVQGLHLGLQLSFYSVTYIFLFNPHSEDNLVPSRGPSLEAKPRPVLTAHAQAAPSSLFACIV